MNKIRHDKHQQVFLMSLDGAEARLEYRLRDHHIDFCSTFVPASFRGQGLAEHLVRHGLSWARQQGYDISASCWYVQKFL